MDFDNAKLFVGGIPRETTEDALRTHFSKYGTVLGSLVAKEKFTRNPRGFGFVWFSDPTFAHNALADSHVILGRMVDVKKAIPKINQIQMQIHQHQQQFSSDQQNNTSFSENNTGNGKIYFRTKKIFVGGLSSSLTEEQFKNYFVRFGKILDVVVMQDSSTNRPRGFGFVTFDSEESVDKVMLNNFHELNGRLVEVKRAVPKEEINAKGANSSYTTKGPSANGFHHQNHPFPYGHGYGIRPGFLPFPGYNGVGWFSYGTGIYGGYPLLGGYGRPGYNGITTIAPRSPWSSPVMVGPVMCNNPFIYPTYINGDVPNMGMTPSGHSGIVGPSENGKVLENSGVHGGQQYDGTLNSGIDSVEE